MSFTVETGLIVANANSYVTTDEADLFFENSGDTVWAGASDENKEYALVAATRYLQQKYRLRWKGARMDAFQALDWPRRGVDVPDFFDPYYTNAFVPVNFMNSAFIPTNVIPAEVKAAQCLLARATMDSTGAPTIVLQASLGRVTKREKLEGLEVEYADSAAGQRQLTVYWDAQEIIRPFLKAESLNTGSVLRS
jgi:hypothetical protein